MDFIFCLIGLHIIFLMPKCQSKQNPSSLALPSSRVKETTTEKTWKNIIGLSEISEILNLPEYMTQKFL